MDLVALGSRVGSLAVAVGSGELVGRYAVNLPKHIGYPAGIGAVAGLVQFSLGYALQPAWTALRLSLSLNPVGQVVFTVLQVLGNALIGALALHHIFNYNIKTVNATVLSAESTGVALVLTWLANAAMRTLT